MIQYIVRRFVQFLLIIFIANSLTFLLPRFIKGDPIEEALAIKAASAGIQTRDFQAFAKVYRERFGLNLPLWRQYLNYWHDLLRLDFGYSLLDYPTTVMTKVMGALPWTLGFMLVATAIAFVVGTTLGAILGWPGSPRLLQAAIPPLMILSAIPFYLFGLALIWIFAVELRVLPPGGGFDPTQIIRFDWATAVNIIQHAILPSLALIVWGVGSWALGMRAMMVSVLGEDYITFARAKALPERQIFFRYSIRNALLPQVTGLAISVGLIIGGSVLIETVFSYPGIGSLTFTAINARDYFVINGTVFIMVLAAATSLFVVDVIYPLIDPRIRYQS